ncbi:MAG: DUF72 domain-containing protein [Gaiellaceae bacterium MAG52_C11]|nr:DUF72 domain-containing protein [Candidatus Gaiellasilicea maunaloa]
MGATVRVGVCSWADETLTKIWYPPGVRSAEDRLHHYTERFGVVEANSTYYRLPDATLVASWAERTPPGFTMHVKAFGLMTRHPVKLEALPEDLRDAMPVDERGRVDRPSRELRAEVFRRFAAALEPLRMTGKLGGILLQFPSYIVHKAASLEYIEWAQAQLPGDELLLEFRHRSWLDEAHRAETLGFLDSRGLSYVIVDAPKTEAKNLVQTVVARTSGTAYIRFHGRNAATWNKRSGSAAERFDYLYSAEELAEWVEPLRELATDADDVYAMFNNNGRSAMPSFGGLAGLDPHEVAGDPQKGLVAQAPANAMMLRQALADAGVAVA